MSLIYAQVTFSEAAEWVIWNFPVFVILLLIFIFGLELMGQIPLEHTWNFWVMPYSLVGIYERARSPNSLTITSVISRGACVIPALPAQRRAVPEPSLGSGWQLVVAPGFHQRVLQARIRFAEEMVFTEEILMAHSAAGFGGPLQVCGRDSTQLASFHSDSPFHPRNHSKMPVGERLG